MRRPTLCVALVVLGLPAAASATVAQQDTSRSRPRAANTVSSGGDVARATYDAPAGDTAIMRLERFLEQYPQSAMRPRALLQLGELLVRRADERFADRQRAGNDTTTRPDYTDRTISGAVDDVPELRAS